jgi:hypothetical protein
MRQGVYGQPANGKSRQIPVARLLLALVIIPLLVPAVLALSTTHSDGARLNLPNYLDSLLPMGTATFAAMVVLGLPLLVIYIRLNQRSVLAFALGGGLCAFITAVTLSGPAPQIATLLHYALAGIVAGVLFRLVLLGGRRAS